MAKQKRQIKITAKVDALNQININAAGIDIGAEEIYVAVPPDRDEQSVRVFSTFTADLRLMAEWLKSCGIKTVAIESTGVYWIPVYEILEEYGIEVCLVNARHLKNVSGRKTDVLDCQWLQQLHTYGLLTPSFRPPEDIVAIRSLVRQRDMLIKYRSAHIQHMQKALTVMNLRLTNVLSDITGVTGLQIIRAIVNGERDPKVLAQFRNNKCAKTEEEIAKSLDGHYKPEQIFILKQALDLYDFYDEQLKSCDLELKKLYQQYEPPTDTDSSQPTPHKRKRRKNQAHFDLSPALFQMTGVDLTQIDGIDALTAQKVISEIGTDMTKWLTVKHFTSWLHLCPNNKVTGGKVKNSRVQPGSNRASTALRVAAATLKRSDSALGAYYRRMRARQGNAAAITSTAHKLARIIYTMLESKKSYQDLGAEYYEQQYRSRVLRSLNKRALSMGFHLEPTALPLSMDVS